MAIFRLATAIVVFGTTCIGFGYFAELLVSRRKWPGWASGLLIFATALIWPIGTVAYTIYDAHEYLKLHPRDDAPAMVVISMIHVGAPLLFFLSFPFILVGVIIARKISRIRPPASA
jgi:hypothetical protein